MKETRFKQTEIGEIPEDWEVTLLSNVAENFTGLTYSPKDVSNYGTLVLRSSNIKNGFLSFENNVYVNMEIPKRVIVQNGDILICIRNGSKNLIGKSALITKEAQGFAFGAFMTILRSTKINQHYLFYFWQSDCIQKQIKESMGATINQITNSDINRYCIYYPKSNIEQQNIASTLSDVDTLITSLEKLIEKKKNIKQGTMQQLLTGKKRLPGFAKSDKYKQTEIGKIPEDWEVKQLDTLCILNPKNNLYLPNNFYYIDLESVDNCKLQNTKRINKTQAPSRAQRVFYKNDILFQTVRPYQQNNLFVNFDSQNYIASTGYTIIHNKENVSNKFIYYAIQTKTFVNDVMDLCTGTSYPAINPTNLKTIKIIIPNTIKEQTAISNILSTMDKEIEALNIKLEKYRLIKQGMMQQLLTGKIRLI